MTNLRKSDSQPPEHWVMHVERRANCVCGWEGALEDWDEHHLQEQLAWLKERMTIASREVNA